MPGFRAETSLYRPGIQYGSMRALVKSDVVMPQQLPHLFCRVTDCPCLYEQCRKAGGTVVPGPQPPCYYKCELNPTCTCTTTRCCDGNCSTSAPAPCWLHAQRDQRLVQASGFVAKADIVERCRTSVWCRVPPSETAGGGAGSAVFGIMTDLTPNRAGSFAPASARDTRGRFDSIVYTSVGG